MDYAHIITKLTTSMWLITPESLQVMLDVLDRRLDGELLDDVEIRRRIAAAGPERQFTNATVVRGVGVLPLSGPIFPKSSLMTELCGMTSLESFRNDFRKLAKDDNVRAILMDIDSPGGVSDLIPEMGGEIFRARSVKPIYAVANTAANSAAYWLASQADKLYVTPSGQVGSIGVYTVHTDESRKREMKGVEETVVAAGRFKAEHMQPMSDEYHEFLQDHVNELYADFVGAVAQGRGVDGQDVLDNYGGGRVMTARQALERGMVDGIAEFDDVLGSMVEHPPVGVGSGGGQMWSYRGVVLSDNTTYITTTTDNKTNLSYDADKEHSDPGTMVGGEASIDPPEKGDKAIEGGWRRDPPPITKEEEQQAMSREQLIALADKLGVAYDDNTTDDELSALVVSGVDDIVTPLIDATEQATHARDFAKEFPEQYAELQELKVQRREGSAREFARQYEKFEGSNKGLSALALDKVEEAHIRVAERNFNSDDLGDLINTITKDGIVDYGEAGGARSSDAPMLRAGATRQEIRKQFADEVARVMEDDSLDRKAAIDHVAKSNPDLAQAYFES